ncbi:transglutaminase-like domain-containing protein [Paeniglutamicibacter cryotolerans]
MALGAGMLGLNSTFAGDPRYLLAGFGSIVLGLGIASAKVRFGLGFAATAGIVLGTYVLFGTVLATPTEATAGVLPNAESLRTLLAGVVLSWKGLLTVAAPVGIGGGMLVVPFFSGLLTALAAGLAAWQWRRPALALVPVALLFVLGIALGTRDAPLPELRGLVLVMVSVGWLAHVKVRDTERAATAASASDPGAERSLLLRRAGAGALVLALAGGISAAATPLLDTGARSVLRDVVEPPIDLYDYPSPMMKFRAYAKDLDKEELFTVAGLPEGERVRLAALDAYDGMVFNVDPRSGGNFSPVGDSGNVGGGAGTGQRRGSGVLDIEITGYDGVWLPGGGTLRGVDWHGPRATELARSLYYNADAETAIGTSGIRPGDGYRATVEFPAKVPDNELKGHGFSTLSLPQLANVPQAAAGKGAEFAGNASTALGRARGIEQMLKTSGYFSHGKQNEVPSLPGHGAARIAALLGAESMIGDDEQYAAAMALMAREQGMPARVVMGFYPETYDESAAVSITGADVHAWVEMAFENVGWVAFDPTPERDKEPTPPQQQPQSVPQPQVLQPPPPPQDEARLPPETAPDPQEAQNEDKPLELVWRNIGAVALWTGVPALLLFAPLALIALLKRRRRSRRHADGGPGDRVNGGWHEVLSLATDLRAEPDDRGTRRENALELAAGFPGSAGTVVVLARRADAAAFGHQEPDEAQVTGYWELVDEQLERMRSAAGFIGRLRARFSARSLRRESRRRKAAADARHGGGVWRRRGPHLRRVDPTKTKE